MNCLIPLRRRSNGVAHLVANDASNTRLDSIVDRLFHDAFGDSWFVVPSQKSEGVAFLPAIDVKESESHVTVRAELPGVDAKEVELELHDDVLVLSGKKEQHSEGKEGDRSWSELRFGSFRREIPLPAPVAPDGVEAACDKGILTVTLKKAQAARTHRIPVVAR